MESTGERDNIREYGSSFSFFSLCNLFLASVLMHVFALDKKKELSAETAELLKAAGKEHWLVKRDDAVEVKGKGKIETYWLQPAKGSGKDANNVMQSQRLLGDKGLSRRASMASRRASMASRRASMASRRASMASRRASLANREPGAGRGFSRRASTAAGRVDRSKFSRRSSTSAFPSQLTQGSGGGSRPLSSDPAKAKKLQRLVDWNCELLQQLLRQIVAVRGGIVGLCSLQITNVCILLKLLSLSHAYLYRRDGMQQSMLLQNV